MQTQTAPSSKTTTKVKTPAVKTIEAFLGPHLQESQDICKHPREEKEKLLEKALEQGNLRSLIPYPCMLFIWQAHHSRQGNSHEVKRVATIASHRQGKHYYCETPQFCATVEKFIQLNTPGQKKLL